jgi:hypothetical protein
MASIYRSARSPFYYCRFKVGGPTVRLSTKQRTSAAAQKVADRLEAEAWVKQSPAGMDRIRDEFVACASKRGIPELAVLDWLETQATPNAGQQDIDRRATIEVLHRLKRLDAKVDKIAKALQAPFNPVLDLKGQFGPPRL